MKKYLAILLVFLITITYKLSVSHPVDFEENTKEEVTELEPKETKKTLLDSLSPFLVKEPLMYLEGWNYLPQPNFWRKIMKMSADSSLVNIAANRTILTTIATEDYTSKTRDGKRIFKEKIIKDHNLPTGTEIYITSGKKHFYQIERAVPGIVKSTQIFEEQNVSPWFAQAILLIESPNKLQKSNVGAYGSFQLMKWVARNNGLTVNKYVDEREDLEKSAKAAARFIKTTCIPKTREILDRWNLEYSENDLWFKLMVLHVYHAGAGNVAGAVNVIAPKNGGQELIKELWQTSYRGFRNASQNYSQLALASLMELDAMSGNNVAINSYKIEPKPAVLLGR
ncbi:transglycosylase SLT domain-containing protein [Flexithrix dorotheae]|uniref:transglycosylase SLT domain-containing protein n=1 Tax=Flexithrix dorotheae TaxID=70993 RepID=UPI0003825CA7|nr:transglycosylase SLT domain-containing protein [Flexithrix dorotheae]